MNILLTADEAAGLHTFRMLNNSNHHIAAVITSENNFAIRKLATQLSIPVMEPSNLIDPAFANWIQTKKIDVLLNVHLLYIIHPHIIGAVTMGAFNLHPGPLPKYAGLNTPSWAIYNREEEYGVTLHWLEEGIDTGHIAYKAPVPLKKDETGLSLSTKCATTGMKLISKLLKDLSSGITAVPRIPQDTTGRKFFKRKEVPQEGVIKWTQTSTKIDAFVRACNYAPFKSPWGYPKTSYKKSNVEISSVTLTEEACTTKPGTVKITHNEFVRVATADYWLSIKTCGIDGKQVPAHTVFKEGDVLG
ncbi:MAG: formyltransferase family protein [Balneolaceae bacterium]